MDLIKKTCLVTGGSAGIGLATAKRFAESGFRISICGRRSGALERATETLSGLGGSENVFSLCGDISNVEFLNQFVVETKNRFGSIGVLVNNAGAAPLCEFPSIEDQLFEDVLDLNVRTVFKLSKMVWPMMKAHGGGAIVNISSMAAVDPFPGFSIYGASKAWIELFTKAIAAEGATHSIRACCVRPGAVETELLRGLFPDFPADQCVRPEEIAEKVWQCVSLPEQHPSGDSFTVAKA